MLAEYIQVRQVHLGATRPTRAACLNVQDLHVVQVKAYTILAFTRSLCPSESKGNNCVTNTWSLTLSPFLVRLPQQIRSKHVLFG